MLFSLTGLQLAAQTEPADANTATPAKPHHATVPSLHPSLHPFEGHDQNQKPLFPSRSENTRKNMLEFRTEEEMSAADHSLVLNAEGTIAERAHFDDLDFDAAPGNPWAMQQAVCPALPRHLIVQFTRNRGKGDVSVFTAIIPRDPEGRIRIIPVEKRGYSLFSPAPVNAITISVFNRIRAEEKTAIQPDWLTLGLCYASMAGARPKADLVAMDIHSETMPEGRPATLVIENNGTAKIIFVDMAARPAPMEWTMSFDKKGRLLKAVHHKAVIIQPSKRTQQITDLK
jgi:hypothetical protein